MPPYGMVWILDQPQGTAQLRRIFLNHIHPNGHRAENTIKAQFLVLRMGSSIEFSRPAKLRIATHAPVIFIRKSQEEEEEIQSSTECKKCHGALRTIAFTRGWGPPHRVHVHGLGVCPVLVLSLNWFPVAPLNWLSLPGAHTLFCSNARIARWREPNAGK